MQWLSGQNSASEAKATEARLHRSYGEVIARKFPLSSLRTGCSLRNIHVQKRQWIVCLLCRFFLYTITDKIFTWLHEYNDGGLIGKGTAHPSRGSGFIPVFCVIHVAHLFSFLCVCFVLLVFVLCLVACISAMSLRFSLMFIDLSLKVKVNALTSKVDRKWGCYT